MLRWIDTHNHLFVLPEEQQKKEVSEARKVGVVSSLVCASGVSNLEEARRCAYEYDQAYACGIHPLYIGYSWKEDLTALEAFLEEHREDPRLAAVGECGLDFSAACSVPHDVQEEVFSTQLKLARKYGLPLSLHGREAMDIVLKYIRRLPPQLGIIHAFNGSMAQAQVFCRTVLSWATAERCPMTALSASAKSCLNSRMTPGYLRRIVRICRRAGCAKKTKRTPKAPLRTRPVTAQLLRN